MDEQKLNGRTGKAVLKNFSPLTKILVGLIIISLVFGIVFSIVGIIYGRALSFEIANDPAYADIKYMRLPVLIMCALVLVLFIIACLIAIPFFIRIIQGKFYTAFSIKLIRLIGLCFYLMIVPAISLIIYTSINVAGSITNLWVLFGACIAFVAGSILMLCANLMSEGRLYKDEIDLTV